MRNVPRIEPMDLLKREGARMSAVDLHLPNSNAILRGNTRGRSPPDRLSTYASLIR